MNLIIGIKSEVLDEAAARYALARRKVERRIGEMSRRLRRGAGEGRLRCDILRPDRIDDRLKDRKRQPRSGLGPAERAALAVAVVVADPHRDGHVIGKADEPAIDRI